MDYRNASLREHFAHHSTPLTPAHIYRANGKVHRNSYSRTEPDMSYEDDRFFPWYNYDHINSTLFPIYGFIAQFHPELEQFFTAKSSMMLSLRSKVSVKIKCPNGHVWKQAAKDFVSQHRHAIMYDKNTCLMCEHATVAEKLSAKAEAEKQRKALNKANRISPSPVPDNATRYFYIHEVLNGADEVVAYKYGIALSVYSRRIQQQNSMQSGLTLKTVYEIKATSKEVITVERQLKKHLSRKYIQPALTKTELADGWTETVKADRFTLEELIEIATAAV